MLAGGIRAPEPGGVGAGRVRPERAESGEEAVVVEDRDAAFAAVVAGGALPGDGECVRLEDGGTGHGGGVGELSWG